MVFAFARKCVEGDLWASRRGDSPPRSFQLGGPHPDHPGAVGGRSTRRAMPFSSRMDDAQLLSNLCQRERCPCLICGRKSLETERYSDIPTYFTTLFYCHFPMEGLVSEWTKNRMCTILCKLQVLLIMLIEQCHKPINLFLPNPAGHTKTELKQPKMKHIPEIITPKGKHA